MLYKQIFTNSYLQIAVYTNSKRIHTLVDNFLGFNTDVKYAPPKIKVYFYLDEGDIRNQRGRKKYINRMRFVGGEPRTASFGNSDVRVTIDNSTATIRGIISDYDESFKERLLQFALTLPLQRILACHGFFYLHTAMVCKQNKCVLICGPGGSGKSTLTLLLSQNGFNPLSDDNCFVKLTKNSVQLFPFPAKIGLNERLLKNYPELAQYAVKSFRYYGKQRISLHAITHRNNGAAYKCKAIIFPKYGGRGELSVKTISKNESLKRLLKCTFVRLYPDREQEVLWAFYTLAQKTPSFKLIYNDSRLDEIPAVIHKITE